MDLTYTSRGLEVTDELREAAEHKLARAVRSEPRATRLDVEFITEHHPGPEGTKRVEAALHLPRKTFRAEGEAPDVLTALDRVAERLERQIRDDHGRRKKRSARKTDALQSARPAPEGAEPSEE